MRLLTKQLMASFCFQLSSANAEMSGSIARALFFYSLALHRAWTLTPDESANLQDPCHFPAPHYAHFPDLCQLPYHRLGFVCDPLAILSRTEAEILNDRFKKYSLAGCVDCEASTRGPSYCVPKKTPHQARVNLLLVPYANVQAILTTLLSKLSSASNRGLNRAWAAASVTPEWRLEMPCASTPPLLAATTGKAVVPWT